MSRVLTVSGLGKRYLSYDSELHRFASWLGMPVAPKGEFWAVRDISFELDAGEALALIGQNGAGKSTLLKLVTGTLRPTTGAVQVNGRTSAILELGLGFNMEFTGRENVRQSGGFLGFSSADIDAMMDDIEDFAELGEFFDKPLRLYSSGMQARLAFSLATAKRPELLIVDEVLSVGDSYFQHKSFARIREFKRDGTAILFVTHSLSDARELCERTVLLSEGRVLRDGQPDEVIDYYNALVAAKENERLSIEQRRQKDGWVFTRSGSGDARLHAVTLTDAAAAEPVKTALVGQSLVLSIEAEAVEALPMLVVGVMLKDRTGHVVWGTNTWHTGQVLKDVPAGKAIHLEARFDCTLGVGSYGVSIALHGGALHLDSNYDWIDNILVFDVVNTRYPYFTGSSFVDCAITIRD